MYGRRAFAVAGPTVWNSLSDNLQDSDVTVDNFKCLLKMFLFFSAAVQLAHRYVMMMHSANLHFTYLLTYQTSSPARAVRCFYRYFCNRAGHAFWL